MNVNITIKYEKIEDISKHLQIISEVVDKWSNDCSYLHKSGDVNVFIEPIEQETEKLDYSSLREIVEKNIEMITDYINTQQAQNIQKLNDEIQAIHLTASHQGLFKSPSHSVPVQQWIGD